MQKSWGGNRYETDQLPSYLTARYVYFPEEFYTKSGIDVVTPGTFDVWFEAHKDLPCRWVLHERWSGSGRLSLAAARGQLPVLFPVDVRYGWGSGTGYC